MRTRSWLVLSVVAAVALAAGVLFADAAAARDRAEAAALDESRRLARLAAFRYEETFQSARQLLEALAQIPAIRENDGAVASPLLARIRDRDPRYANLGVADARGWIWSSALPIIAPVDASQRTWFRRATESRRFSVGDFQIGTITGLATINVSLPLFDADDRLLAVIFAAIDLGTFEALARRADLPEGGALTVFDSHGTILVRHPEARRWFGHPASGHPMVRTVLEKRDGTATVEGLDGTTRIVGFVPLEHGAGFVAVGLAHRAVHGPASAQLNRNLAWLGVVLLLAVAGVWFLGEWILLLGVRGVVATARRLGAGDLAARTRGLRLRGEIAELGRAFDDMADALERREREARDAEERYRRLVEEVPGVFYVGRPPTFVSPQIEALLGYSPREWLADAGLRERSVHADDRDRVAAAAPPYVLEYRLIGKDGRVRWVRDSTTGERGFLTDITERKAIQEQLFHAQKMDAIGRLTGAIAHDFRNVLSAVQGFSDLLLMDLPADSPARPFVEEIHGAGLRAVELIRQLLAFGRRETAVPRIIRLNEAVAGAAKMLKSLVGENIRFVHRCGDDVGPVLADPGQIEQVLMNLVVNARDAMPRGGTLVVETSAAELNEEYARMHLDVRPGRYALLAVSDTGTGMTPETMSHLFEPFFTTKPKGQGTGLGLSTVYAIVKQSGGHIWVYSEPGQGSSFKIYLPIVEAGAESAPAPALPAPAAGGTETILVVEDDDGVRKFIFHALRKQGYVPLEARNADEGLRVAEAHREPIPLALCDWVMPGLDGGEFAERLRASRPETRLVFLSGYSQAVLPGSALPAGAAFLEKPFTSDTLIRTVRDILDSATREGARS